MKVLMVYNSFGRCERFSWVKKKISHKSWRNNKGRDLKSLKILLVGISDDWNKNIQKIMGAKLLNLFRRVAPSGRLYK